MNTEFNEIYDQSEVQLRERLRKMDDASLIRFARSCKFMCSPEATMGKPPKPCYVNQLRWARFEWYRRYSKSSLPLNC